MKHFRSVVSLLLVFVLCFGMIPCAFADEITTPAVPQPSEGSASEAVPPLIQTKRHRPKNPQPRRKNPQNHHPRRQQSLWRKNLLMRQHFRKNWTI